MENKMNFEDLYKMNFGKYNIFDEYYRRFSIGENKFDFEMFHLYKNLLNKGIKDIDAKCLINQIFMLGLQTITYSNQNKSITNKNFSIKINTSANEISSKDLTIILKSFKAITQNFCNLFHLIDSEWDLNIISISSGCLDIKLGINIDKIEINLIKFSNKIEEKIVNNFIKDLTGKNIDEFDNNYDLIHSCIKEIFKKDTRDYEENDIITYLDLKQISKYKNNIKKCVKKLPKEKSSIDGYNSSFGENIDLIL